ncbi:MAG: UpxY family transcription antiterminator [Flavobacteriales bacterium]|nr:UpxY family transcription antiterminator [Flavobacteriales bacterium]
MPWYLLYTKPKHEKKVEFLLNDVGIKTFLPTIIERRKWSDRVKKVERVLFSSYIFIDIEIFFYELIFQPGVVRVIKDENNKPREIPEKIIHSIQGWLSENKKKDVEVMTFKQGDSVELDTLFFQAKHGIIERVKKDEFIILLEGTGIKLSIAKEKIIRVVNKGK